ncbi:DUF4440 domain-containing protein [bacterium]|nr:DUF4440 domain-containing protein [bacterium]
MKNLSVILIIVLVSIIPLQAVSQEDTIEEIKTLSEKFVDMLSMENRTPLEEIESMLADDMVQISSSGEVFHGIKENMVFYTKGVMDVDSLFSEFDAGYVIESVKIMGNTAQVFGKLKLRGKLKKNDVKFDRDILESLLFVKTLDSWKITHEHSTRL